MAAITLVAYMAAGASPAGADLTLDTPVGVYVQYDSNPNIHDKPEEMDCDPGSEWAAAPTATSDAKVTHAVRYEHFTGGSGSYTKTASHRTTISAGINSSASSQVNVGKVIAELEVTVKHELHAAGERTRESSITVSENLTKNDVYIFFAGTKEYSASFNYYRCNSNSQAELRASGEVHSWDIEGDGAVGCSQEVPAKSMAAKAKAQYCSEGDATAYADFVLASLNVGV